MNDETFGSVRRERFGQQRAPSGVERSHSLDMPGEVAFADELGDSRLQQFGATTMRGTPARQFELRNEALRDDHI